MDVSYHREPPAAARACYLATMIEDDKRIDGVIERFVPGGHGLVRTDAGVMLVRGGLVGERVRADVVRARRNMREATVAEVLEPSPERVDPDCGLHPRCGGCDFLDLSARAQAAAKAEMVTDGLRRIAKIDTASIRFGVREAPLFARARRRARLATDGEGRLGYHERKSHRVIATSACPALAAPLEAALLALGKIGLGPRLTVRAVLGDGDRVSLAISGAPRKRLSHLASAVVDRGIAAGVLVQSDSGRVLTEIGDAAITGEIAPGLDGGPYASDAATFSQATRFGAEAIIAEVAAAAGALSGRRVLELYAGAGHLTLPAVLGGAEIAAVEVDERAILWLSRNLETSGAAGSRARVVRAAIGRAATGAVTGARPRFDMVIADPPRTGATGLGEILARTQPRDVILVSCDIATGARDIRVATEAGLTLGSLTVIDAFPRTSHVEWVAHLSR